MVANINICIRSHITNISILDHTLTYVYGRILDNI